MMAANTVLSSIIIDNIILLPSYKIELDNFMEFINYRMREMIKEVRYSLVNKPLEIKQAIYPIKDILNSIIRKKNSDIIDYHDILKYIENHYSDLYKLISLSISDYREEVDNLFKNNILVYDKDPLGMNISPSVIIANAEDNWFPLLCRVRPEENKRYANFMDALTIEYILAINQEFRKRKENKVVTLITGSEALYKVLKEQDKGEIIIGKRKIPLLRRPELFWVMLLSSYSINNCRTMRKHASKDLEIIDKLLVSIRSLLSCYSRKPNREYDKIANREIRYIEDYIKKYQNIDMANKDNILQERIQNHILKRMDINKIKEKRVTQSINALYKLMESDNFIESINIVADKINNDIDSIHCKIEAMAFIKLRIYLLTRTADISYMVEFNDEKIRSIYERIIDNTDIDGAINDLNKIRQDNGIEKYPEICLLTAYLLEKEGNLDSAENELRRVRVRSLLNKKKFIQNMIYARRKLYNFAILGCDVLVKNKPNNPRYYIQRAYYIWLAIKQGTPNIKYSLQNAIDDLIIAIDLSCGNNKILRVIYFDMVLIYAEMGKTKKIEKAFNELIAIRKYGIEGPLYDFAKGVLFLSKYEFEKDEEKAAHYINIAKESIDKAYQKVPWSDLFLEYKNKIYRKILKSVG
jgi:hypothetical protein